MEVGMGGDEGLGGLGGHWFFLGGREGGRDVWMSACGKVTGWVGRGLWDRAYL